jgi:cytochrome P450
MDSTTQFLFGKPRGGLAQRTQPDIVTEFVNSFEMAMNFAYQRTGLGFLIYLDRNYSQERERQHLARTRQFVDIMINEAVTKYIERKASKVEAGTDNHKSLLEMLMDSGGFPAMKDHIMAIFVAARDTTATLLSQLWFEVSRRPDVFSKMKNEVDSVLNGQLPTADTLRKLPYVDQVMKETLRLWPPMPTTIRVANKVCYTCSVTQTWMF